MVFRIKHDVMKTKLILLFLCISLFFSCYEDKGNYSYGELETIKISNVESEYTKIYLDERLQIDPQVETSDPHADLKYKWTFLGDTIALSSQLALDTFMSWKPASYNLVLQVTNSNTGYTVYKQTKVTVNTEFSIGWYVLKDDGSVADLDLYTDTKLIPNVIQRVNGTPLQGRGEKISFFADHDVFDADNNKYSGKAILFCLTDKDINGIGIANQTNTTIKVEKDEDMPKIIDIIGNAFKLDNKNSIYPILNWQ